MVSVCIWTEHAIHARLKTSQKHLKISYAVTYLINISIYVIAYISCTILSCWRQLFHFDVIEVEGTDLWMLCPCAKRLGTSMWASPVSQWYPLVVASIVSEVRRPLHIGNSYFACHRYKSLTFRGLWWPRRCQSLPVCMPLNTSIDSEFLLRHLGRSP